MPQRSEQAGHFSFSILSSQRLSLASDVRSEIYTTKKILSSILKSEFRAVRLSDEFGKQQNRERQRNLLTPSKMKRKEEKIPFKQKKKGTLNI